MTEAISAAIEAKRGQPEDEAAGAVVVQDGEADALAARGGGRARAVGPRGGRGTDPGAAARVAAIAVAAVAPPPIRTAAVAAEAMIDLVWRMRFMAGPFGVTPVL